jgi:hypothetical protein
MSKTKEETPKAPAPPSIGKAILGYVIGAGLGLVALFVLSSLLKSPPASQDELPHLAILVQASNPGGFADPAARKALAKLHRDLIAVGDLAVLGPLNYPVLVPAAPLTPRDFDTLTEAELEAARPFFGVGGYLSRVFSPDLRYAILRAGPKAGVGFVRGVAGRVEALADEVTAGGALRATPYSQALQLGGDADVKATLNLYFGVQTVLVDFQPKDKGGAGKPESIREVYAAARAFVRPVVRGVASEGTFLHYACAVQGGDPKLGGIPGVANEQLLPILAMARAAKIPALVAQDGSLARVEIYTEAEEQANRELGYDFRANAPSMTTGTFHFRRAK